MYKSFLYRLPNISTILYDLQVRHYRDISKWIDISKFLLPLRISIQTKKSCRTQKSKIFEEPKKYLIFKLIDLMQSILCWRKNEL